MKAAVRVELGLSSIAATKTAAKVNGIPCTLKRPQSRRVVFRVLRRIQEKCPEDFERLLVRIQLIRPRSEKETQDGSPGEWIAKTFEDIHRRIDPNQIAWADPIRLQWGEYHSGIVELAEEGATAENITTTLAHELGHACTTEEDRSRTNAPTDEWASETAADRYAYKWGFGKLIAKDRKTRLFLHHGPGLGQTVGIDGCTYRLSRTFIYRKIPEPG